MVFTSKYESPLGEILLAADEVGLIGLWLNKQKYYANNLPKEVQENDNHILNKTKRWLDIYFSSKEPNFTPPLHLIGSSFRIDVWNILLEIPYGKTITYGEIAKKIKERRNTANMSSQAIGGAVSHNNISIIIPCHRVIGKNGNLTGYAGGLDKKISLLKYEHVDIKNLFFPK